MGSRIAILAGLLAGVIAGGAALAAFVVYGPEFLAMQSPGASASPDPSVPAPPTLVAASPTPVPSSSSAPAPSSPTPVPTPAATTLAAAFHIGERAPALKVAKVGGGEVDLAKLKGRPVWIVFMATWCPSCQDEFPLMNGFAARYAEAGLVVVAVDMREPAERVQAFADRLAVVFPMTLDPDGKAADDWGVVVPPIHFWIDEGGVVRDGALGGIGPDIMVEALKKVMPGTDITP